MRKEYKVQGDICSMSFFTAPHKTIDIRLDSALRNTLVTDKSQVLYGK